MQNLGAAEATASVFTAGAAYACGIIIPIGLKVVVLQYGLGKSDTISQFYGELMWRLSDDRVGASGVMAAWKVFSKLWEDRSLVFIGRAPLPPYITKLDWSAGEQQPC